MLDYVVKLTKEPGSMVEADVQILRDAGFSDVGILDIVQVAGYYAYVNRLADGYRSHRTIHLRRKNNDLIRIC